MTIKRKGLNVIEGYVDEVRGTISDLSDAVNDMFTELDELEEVEVEVLDMQKLVVELPALRRSSPHLYMLSKIYSALGFNGSAEDVNKDQKALDRVIDIISKNATI